jgi:hypothetical protein
MLHRRPCRVSNRLDFAGAPELFVMSHKVGIPIEFQWFAPSLREGSKLADIK